MADLEIFRKTLGSMGVNCYILVNHDTDECIVFDPGDEAGVLKEIFQSPAFQLKAIFLTHGHFDHIGAVQELKNTFQVPIYASKEEDDQVLGNAEVNLSMEDRSLYRRMNGCGMDRKSISSEPRSPVF